MRDDIHKGAPVRRRWKAVIRACISPASWREIAPVRAEAALIDELSGTIRPKFLKSLHAKIHGSDQLELTTPPIDPQALRLIAKSRIENLIIDHTLIAISKGASRPEAHEQGFACAIQEFKESICRTVEAHAFEEAPGSARTLTARLQHTLATAGAALPKMLVKGRLPHRAVRSKPTPSLDIALPLKGGQGGKRTK